jgi:lipopolysaccharide export system protein LptC
MPPGVLSLLGNRLTTLIPLVLVGLLVALTFWLDNISQPAPRSLGGSRHDPDYIVDNLSAVRIGETGSAAYTLSAEKLMHYPDDDSTILTAPKFVSHRATPAPVTITASQAVVSANGEHVYFQDNVRVTRAASRDASELVARTDFLHVVPDLGIARTDRTVTITDAATKVTAVGLELNSETRVLKLQSNVRGTYDPAAAPRKGGGR